MGLTVAEKTHWKERISRKIAQAIEELLVRGERNYLQRTQAAAKQQATIALGVAELLAKHERLEAEVKQLGAEKTRVEREILAALRGVPADEVCHPYGWDTEMQQAIKRVQKPLEKKLLAADPLGREILRLRHEEEELLDTVWLATSPQQIRALWQSVSELLAGELTPLQQKAMSLPPMSDADGERTK